MRYVFLLSVLCPSLSLTNVVVQVSGQLDSALALATQLRIPFRETPVPAENARRVRSENHLLESLADVMARSMYL
jgi:hypothetical protein